MQKNDIINTPSYGIYIDDIRGGEDSGKSITFGGIDVAKFTLPLKTLSTPSNYSLSLLGIDIVSERKVVSKPLELPGSSPRVSILGLGAASIHLPSDVFDLVMTDLGAEGPDYLIDTLPPDGSGLNFAFADGLSIFVPYSQMAAPILSNHYLVLLVPNDGDIILGTPFFRSAYVFFDFQNEEISIAPALYNITASNIIEVGANNASILDIKWLYEDGTREPTPLPTNSPRPIPTPGASSDTAVIVVGVVAGVAIVSIAVAVSLYLLCYRSRNPRIITVVPQMQEGNGMTPVHSLAPYNSQGVNGQFSPTQPIYSSSVTSTVPATSTNPWTRPGNVTALNPRTNAHQI
ncbi:hypothetical protein TWF173_011344 [Orbilia oligospora]|nr:hypothetical protein TWF173_011344 [Orbilia oligospora]